MIIDEEIHTSSVRLFLIEEQVINCKVNDYVNFLPSDVQEIRDANKILSKGKPYCVLFEVGKHVDLTKSAREASVEARHYKNRIALALLHTNFAMKMLSDFYIRIYKPPLLTRNFSSRENAIAWLKEMKDSYTQK